MGLNGHNGMDVQATHGQTVRAAHDGTVTFAGEDGSAGYGIVIRTNQMFDYNGGQTFFKTIYWHLKKEGMKVTAGQQVKSGDIIGLADNTGMSLGDHLHFGLKPIYKGEKDWEWWNSDQLNGYKGAIDPAPYFTGQYADEVYVVPKASDQIAVFAAKLQSDGNITAAKQMYALAAMLRTFGY